NISNQRFSKQAIQLMRSILTTKSSKEVQLILNKISLTDEARIEINPKIWYIVGKTTNIAESAHADINHNEKELSLINTIK
ncbi:33861_t:CDS:2, partial [Gigaspora margarita]